MVTYLRTNKDWLQSGTMHIYVQVVVRKAEEPPLMKCSAVEARLFWEQEVASSTLAISTSKVLLSH